MRGLLSVAPSSQRVSPVPNICLCTHGDGAGIDVMNVLSDGVALGFVEFRRIGARQFAIEHGHDGVADGGAGALLFAPVEGELFALESFEQSLGDLQRTLYCQNTHGGPSRVNCGHSTAGNARNADALL